MSSPRLLEPFLDTLAPLREQGLRLAVDDAGAGYSSLKALVEIEPDYMKFDVSMVRQIDRDGSSSLASRRLQPRPRSAPTVMSRPMLAHRHCNA